MPETPSTSKMDKGPKAIAALGIAYLESAILEVMMDQPLHPSEIAQRLGIAHYPSENGTNGFAMVHGLLRKLASEGQVERYHNGTRWKRTDGR